MDVMQIETLRFVILRRRYGRRGLQCKESRRFLWGEASRSNRLDPRGLLKIQHDKNQYEQNHEASSSHQVAGRFFLCYAEAMDQAQERYAVRAHSSHPPRHQRSSERGAVREEELWLWVVAQAEEQRAMWMVPWQAVQASAGMFPVVPERAQRQV